MSWNTTITTIVRHLINDLEDTPVYSDARLEKAIVISGTFLLNEVSFDKTYTISIDDSTISPDPTAETLDTAFISLVGLRTAVLIYDNEAKLASRQGIKVTDGPSSIDTTGRLGSALQLVKDMRDQYEKAKIAYVVGNARSGKALLGPYTVPFLDGGNGLN